MVKDKVVKILLTSNLNVYWFKNYSEMEYVLDYLSIDNIQFIIIG